MLVRSVVIPLGGYQPKKDPSYVLMHGVPFALLTTSGGVLMGGFLGGGDGHFGWTLVGSTTGALASGAVIGLSGPTRGEELPLATRIALVGIGAVVGGSLGYELSSQRTADGSPRQAAAPLGLGWGWGGAF